MIEKKYEWISRLEEDNKHLQGKIVWAKRSPHKEGFKLKFLQLFKRRNLSREEAEKRALEELFEELHDDNKES